MVCYKATVAYLRSFGIVFKAAFIS